MTVVVADGCEAAAQLLKKFHAFDVNGSKRFERQWDERVCIIIIIIIISIIIIIIIIVIAIIIILLSAKNAWSKLNIEIPNHMSIR